MKWNQYQVQPTSLSLAVTQTIHRSLPLSSTAEPKAKERERERGRESLPVHSQGQHTQKVGRPPFLQRACNVTVGKEKRKTLLWLFRLLVFLICESRIQQKTKQGCCGLLSGVGAGSRKAFKNIPFRRENTHTHTEVARQSFPGDTSIHAGGFCLANEDGLQRGQRLRITQSSPSLPPSHSRPLARSPSVFTTPSLHFSNSSYLLCTNAFR